MTSTADSTFDVTMQPGPVELDGAVTRSELTKTFHGDLEGAGTGIMFSGGDPHAGATGNVAIEVVRGRLADRHGSVAFQQSGSMSGGTQTLLYAIFPGSGSGDLAGITGTVDLTIDDGTHRYHLRYDG